VEPSEARVELLIGCVVCDAAGERLGHLEEILAERVGDGYVVREYHVGTYASLERLLGAGMLGRSLLHVVSFGRLRTGFVIPWKLMDLSDPEHPRTTCLRSELKPL
jgi:hypothetical protein